MSGNTTFHQTRARSGAYRGPQAYTAGLEVQVTETADSQHSQFGLVIYSADEVSGSCAACGGRRGLALQLGLDLVVIRIHWDVWAQGLRQCSEHIREQQPTCMALMYLPQLVYIT